MSGAVGGGPGTEEGIADLGREIANDAARLVRAEIELARAELAQTVRRLRNAAILFAAALLFGLLLLVALVGAAADGVGSPLGGAWRGWLVCAAALLILAAILGVLGYRAVRGSISSTRDAVGSIKEDAAWLRLLTRRGRKGS